MISFMVIAAPRSGTTWASNWLTTDRSLCYHGLAATKHYTEWDAIESDRMLGVSEPSICMFPEWLNQHPARKVILHRDAEEIAQSLGMPARDWGLDKIEGVHVPWTALFEEPRAIYEFLLQRDFDPERHAILADLEINHMLEKVKMDPAVARRMVADLRERMRG